jgi:transposase
MSRLAERFPTMVKELRRKGVTLQLLWEEYLREHPDGYQNSQFCHHFHHWRKSAEVGMHIDHKEGETLFVDYVATGWRSWTRARSSRWRPSWRSSGPAS